MDGDERQVGRRYRPVSLQLQQFNDMSMLMHPLMFRLL